MHLGPVAVSCRAVDAVGLDAAVVDCASTDVDAAAVLLDGLL